MSEHSPPRPERAAAAVSRHIEDMILEGSLRPGESLLPERQLAERLNVSRPTLRDALKSLEQRGFLTSRRGRGMQVAALGAQSITDPLIALLAERSAVAEDYLEFRQITESEAARLAAQRGNDLDLQRIQQCITHIDEAHGRADPTEEADADAALHLAICEASHNLVLLQVYRALSDNLRADVLYNRQRMFVIPRTRDLLREQHMSIAKAILARDSQAARDAAYHHLDFVRRTCLEIRQAEATRDQSQRRLDGGGLVAPRNGGAPRVSGATTGPLSSG